MSQQADENHPWFSPFGHRDAMSNFIPDEIVTKSPGRLHGCRW